MVTRHLWRSVDGLIITPIEKSELGARMQILLRARSLSLKLQEGEGDGGVKEHAASAFRAARAWAGWNQKPEPP